MQKNWDERKNKVQSVWSVFLSPHDWKQQHRLRLSNRSTCSHMNTVCVFSEDGQLMVLLKPCCRRLLGRSGILYAWTKKFLYLFSVNTEIKTYNIWGQTRPSSHMSDILSTPSNTYCMNLTQTLSTPNESELFGWKYIILKWHRVEPTNHNTLWFQ